MPLNAVKMLKKNANIYFMDIFYNYVRKKFTSIFAAFGSIWQHLAAKYAIRAPRHVAHSLERAAAKCRI